MKIRPVILCGGAGTRLWENSRKNPVKQFIDFGNWTLFGRTLDRVNNLLFDTPIISTNKKYIKQVKKYLKKHKIRKFKIIVEPVRKNTGPAILATSLIKEIPNEQAIIFLSSDHLIDKASLIPKIKLEKTANVIGKNTKSAVRAGFYHGYTGLIENIIKLIFKQTRKKFKIILTGGFAHLFKSSIKGIKTVDKNLTIKGILRVAIN